MGSQCACVYILLLQRIVWYVYKKYVLGAASWTNPAVKKDSQGILALYSTHDFWRYPNWPWNPLPSYQYRWAKPASQLVIHALENRKKCEFTQVKHNHQYMVPYLPTHTYIYIMYNVHAVLCFMAQKCSVHSLCDPHWLSTRHAYAASVMLVYVSNMSDLEMVTLGSFSWIGPPCLWLNRLRTWRLAEVEKGEVLKFWCQWLFPQ